jgi:peroxiredoxin family protein
MAEAIPLSSQFPELREGTRGQRDLALGPQSLCLFVCSGDFERVLAALTVANAAAVMGTPVRMFFAFFAAAALRRPGARPARGMFDRLIAGLMPASGGDLPLSRNHFAGLGTRLLKWRMRAKGFPGFEEQLRIAADAGVQIHVCSASLDLLGLGVSDLVNYPGLGPCGVATFVSESLGANVTMFV